MNTEIEVRLLGPLEVTVDTDENPVGVFLDNLTKKTVSGIQVAGVLKKPARPLVTGKSAFCRIVGSTFQCKVDAIPRGRSAQLSIGHSGTSAPRGTVALKVGAAHSSFQLLFSR